MGNLGNLSYLTATSIAANLFSMIFWSFGFLRMGTVGMVSQALGQNNYQEILNIILRNLIFVLMVSVLIFISQFFILNLSLKIFDLSELTKEFYIQYFKIRIYSAPGELTLYIITGLFVGLQKTKISSLAVGFFSILNIVLSVILVTRFDLNIKGVAYGTLFSALVTSVIFLTVFSSTTVVLSMIISARRFPIVCPLNVMGIIRSVSYEIPFSRKSTSMAL
jgi:MATE family multidrug resistance protein